MEVHIKEEGSIGFGLGKGLGKMKHLRYGGSTAARTYACPGWVEQSKDIPKRPAGQAAIDGSMHHEVMERCQRDEVTPEQCLGLIYKEDGVTREFTEDDLDLSNIAYNAANAVMDTLDIDELLVEPFLQIIEGEAGGSIDLLGLSADKKTLMVLDYKFGRKKVKAIKNAQLMFYALCAMRDAQTSDMFKHLVDIQCVIIQPYNKTAVDRWRTNTSTVNTFAFGLDFTGTGGTKAGDHCEWCPAAPYCDTKRRAVHEATLLEPKTHNKLIVSAAMVVEVEDWLKSTKEEMYLQMCRGVSVTGWKIVQKRCTRKWVDEDKAAKGIKLPKKDMFKTTMLTPAAMEKVVKKKKVKIDLDEFIISVSPGTTIATDDDSREAVIVSDVQGELKEMMK